MEEILQSISLMYSWIGAVGFGSKMIFLRGGRLFGDPLLIMKIIYSCFSYMYVTHISKVLLIQVREGFDDLIQLWISGRFRSFEDERAKILEYLYILNLKGMVPWRCGSVRG
jgi:hypothetical protein